MESFTSQSEEKSGQKSSSDGKKQSRKRKRHLTENSDNSREKLISNELRNELLISDQQINVVHVKKKRFISQSEEKSGQKSSSDGKKQSRKRKRHLAENSDNSGEKFISSELRNELLISDQQINGVHVKKKRYVNEIDEPLHKTKEKPEAVFEKKKKSKQKESSVENGDDIQKLDETNFNASLLSRVCATSTPYAVKEEELHTSNKDEEEKEHASAFVNHLQYNNVTPAGTIKKKAKKKKKMSVSRIVKEKDQTTRPRPGEGFQILGKIQQKGKPAIKRILPDWLANPTKLTVDLKHCEDKVSEVLELDSLLIQKLHSNGIEYFFPVQLAVIPWLLKNGSKPFRPSDICVSAPTGSGKTLAFVLPIIQMLLNRTVTALRALIMLPVGELALQVYKVFQNYCAGTGLKVGLIIGQTTFAEEQSSLVRNSVMGPQSLVDILVATPGKLVDHLLKTPGFTFKHLKFLVIDEADRMMTEIKEDWLKYVEDNVFSQSLKTEEEKYAGALFNKPVKLPPPALTAAMALHWCEVPQKLLFSATLSQNPEKLQQLNLFQPKLFTSVVKSKDSEETDEMNTQENAGEFIGKFTTPAELEEFYIECDMPVKPLIIYYLIKRKKFRRVLCFTNSLENSFRLSQLMKMMGLRALEYSSHLPIKRREKVLQVFQQGKIHVLICTDAMARGMDIVDVDYVISYDLPHFVKTYIHRVGRTARAGKAGTALSLLTPEQVKTFQQLLQKAGKDEVLEYQVNEAKLTKYENLYREALHQVSSIMKKRKLKNMRKSGQLNNKRFRYTAFRVR